MPAFSTVDHQVEARNNRDRNILTGLLTSYCILLEQSSLSPGMFYFNLKRSVRASHQLILLWNRWWLKSKMILVPVGMAKSYRALDSEGSAHVFVVIGVSSSQSHELLAKGVFQWDELRAKALIREALTMSMNSCMDQQVQASPCTPWAHLWKLLIS